MSMFFNWWVIILTLANIAACWWLIRWTSRRRADEAPQGEVTGHTWDEDLQEFNNPLPRWWLWMFYLTLIFAVVYLVLYPGFGRFAGTFGWTQEGQYQDEMAKAEADYGPIFQTYAQQDLGALSRDPAARKVGQRLFLNYCATCHGSDAGGAPGFPSLADHDWLYGGSPAAIKASILDGRSGTMPAFGPALGDEGLEQVTAYVLSLSGRSVDGAAAAAGRPRFETLCAGCHQADGTGNTLLGAPNLADRVWLYGGSPGVVRKTIAEGRNGRMPPHRDFLGEDKAHVLAAYVFSLSGNE